MLIVYRRRHSSSIPFILQVAYVLATRAHPSHIVILCVGYARSPQSHSYLCSWGLTPLPPLSNSNYFGYVVAFSFP
ncbi:hypothetical protein DPP16_16545 [Salmonella enterica subsp. salamae serovar Sofia]|nr:hypothetical protein [Salmonella enterica subsp. salamae serovar Sofia]